MLLKFNTEREWLAERAKNINSTDLAALFGMSTRKSRLKLWHLKKGNIEEDDLDDNPYVIWGKRLQNAIGQGICEDHGWQCFDLTGYYIVDREKRLGASMDVRAVCEVRGDGLIEVKKVENQTEENGWIEDRAPIEYEFQLQGQFKAAHEEKLGINWGGIGVLARRQKSSFYEREREETLAPLIDAEVESFWKSIRDNNPPPPDYLVDGEILAKMRGPMRQDDFIRLTDNKRAVELLDEIRTLKALKVPLNAEIDSIDENLKRRQNEFLDIMGRNANAVVGEWQVKAPIRKVEDKVIYGYETRGFYISKRKGK